MHVVARHAAQALLRDAVRGPVPGAVVEKLGWFDRLKLQVNLHAVALVGADQPTGRIECEALLIVPRHDLVQIFAADANVVARAGGQQVVNTYPPARLKRQAQPLGLMAEMFAATASGRRVLAGL